jgi:hypothetical protein
MSTPIPHYERRNVQGSFTVIEIDLEPGRTAMVPIRTELIGTPDGDAMIRRVLEDHAATKDILSEFG